MPCAAIASNEGVPSYYQSNNTQNANRAAYGQYAAQGYTQYVGQSGNKQIVGSQTTSYQVPRPTVPTYAGAMTANGIALPADEKSTTIYATYARRFADFDGELFFALFLPESVFDGVLNGDLNQHGG